MSVQAIRGVLFPLAVLGASLAPAGEIFVSGSDPQASDQNPGTASSPLKTIRRAAALAGPGDTVLIRAGTYRETVVPARSGSKDAPITYMPYNNEKVVVNGAEPVTNWTNHSGSIYKAPLNWSVNQGDGDQVFADGRMMNYARFPNSSFDVSNPARIIAETGVHTPSAPNFLQKCSATYTAAALCGLPDSKLDATWAGATIHFELMGQGYVETGTVTGTAPGSVTFSYVSQAGGPGDPAAGDPFYITGKLSALDAAGEWFRDAATNTLYLWTPASGSPADHVVEAKARTYGFDLSGLSHITIRGIRFFACAINMSAASTHNTLDGIQALYVSHFESASGADTLWTPHMEDTGVIIRGSGNVLKNSEIGFSAGNGVLLQGHNRSLEAGNAVVNNLIHNVDYMCLDEAGINSGNPLYPPGNGKGPSLYDATSTYNTISRNTIFNSARSLILIRNFGSGLILNNHLYNAMLQSLDGGALYSYNQNGKAFDHSHPDTRIACNLIQNVHTSADKMSVGIYLDNNSFHYVVDHNLIHDVWLPLYFNSDALDNTVCNNTLIATEYGTACFQACGDGSGTLVANNIFRNRTHIPGTKYGLSHNLEAKADPLFVAPAGLNFQLQAASPARNAGEAVSPYTDGFAGTAPDIGALPFGQKPWTAGADPAANPFMRAVPAAPGHLTAAAAGDSVTLAWQDNSANETGFVLEGSPDALDFRPVASVPPGTASYTDSATIHRFYRVCAMNGWYQSPYSNTARCNATSASTSIAAWTLSVASNPAGVNWWNFFGDGHNWVKYSNLCFARSLDKVSVTYSTEAGAKYAGNRIEFRLDSPTGPVIGHVVTRSSGGWGNFITDSGAVSGVNSGAHDLYITFSPIDAPWPVVLLHTFEFSDTKGLAAPTGLAAAAVPDGSVDLSWTAATDNHAGFKIERATDALTFVEIAALEAGARSHRDTTAPPKQSCYYRIRAFNRAFGNSAYSNVAALVRGH